jgi:hypothetical protein
VSGDRQSKILLRDSSHCEWQVSLRYIGGKFGKQSRGIRDGKVTNLLKFCFFLQIQGRTNGTKETESYVRNHWDLELQDRSPGGT